MLGESVQNLATGVFSCRLRVAAAGYLSQDDRLCNGYLASQFEFHNMGNAPFSDYC